MSTVFGDREMKVETISANTQINVEDSGTFFTLNATAGKQVLLPATPPKGFYARFTVGATFATSNWTIESNTDVIQGSADVNSTLVPASNENTISFVASAETVGDYIEVWSDGVNYYAYGIGQASGSITFTAV